jgi:hypothetical protein
MTAHLGIDQTGAIDARGRPRPLPACLLEKRRFRFFALPAFQRSVLASSVAASAATLEKSQLTIGLDCVLGLPESVGVRWREALRGTLKHEGYGRKPARAYFKALGQGEQPRRKVELLCRANSVFAEHPFQKNIQTGTFRFWKEMAQDADWFFAPLLEGEKDQGRIPIFEGYPSLGWKLLLGANTRQPQALGELLRAFDRKLHWSAAEQALVEKDPNFADALVLALMVREFAARERRAQIPSPEGWILGASAAPT